MAKSTASHASESEHRSELQRNGPAFSVRHRALKAAVWKNDTENGPMFNTTITRSYKDGETWKESGSFGFDDLLVVGELLRTCYGFISREMAKLSEEARQ